MYSFHAVGAGERRFWLFSQVQNKWCRKTLLPSTGALVFLSFQVTPYLLWPSLSVSFYCFFFFLQLENHLSKIWPQWFIQSHKMNVLFKKNQTRGHWSTSLSQSDGWGPSAHPVDNVSGTLWSGACSHACLQNPIFTCVFTYMYKIILLTAGTLPLSSG